MEKPLQFIRMYTKIIIAYSVEANSLLGAMKILYEDLRQGLYAENIQPVEKNIQVEPYKWEKKHFPGGIIVVDNNNTNLYKLEFSDDLSAVLIILQMDIQELEKKEGRQWKKERRGGG